MARKNRKKLLKREKGSFWGMARKKKEKSVQKKKFTF